jgi:hypothetical protein
MLFLQERLVKQVVQEVAQVALPAVIPLLAVQELLGKVLLVAEVMQAETVVAGVGLLPLVVLQLTLRQAVRAALVLHQVFLARQ